MAFTYDVSNISGSNINGIFLYALKESLLSAGWLLKGSGNGVDSYDNINTNNSSQATDYVSSSDAIWNARSWFRVRTPGRLPDGNYREITIQNLKTGLAPAQYYARIKYSRCEGDVGFCSGSITGSYNVTPTSATASDEYIVNGSGVGSDTGSYDFYGSGDLTGEYLLGTSFNSSTFYWSSVADSSSPYTFYFMSHEKTSKTVRAIIGFFPILAGTYNSGDTDPYIFLNLNATNPIKSILGIGTANQAMVALETNPAPTAGQDLKTGNDILLPAEFYRLASSTPPRGWKGVSSYILSSTAGSSRSALDTYNVVTTRDFIFLSTYFILPWNGTVPLF